MLSNKNENKKTFFVMAIITLIIICLFYKLLINIHGDEYFNFTENVETISAYSFSFSLKKLDKVNGIISFGADGNFENVYIEDASGRVLTLAFHEGRIINYGLQNLEDNEENYEVLTSILRDLSAKVNSESKIIIYREEKLNGEILQYFIDSSKPPFVFFEFPEEFLNFGLFELQ